jgi:hypothetical protein
VVTVAVLIENEGSIPAVLYEFRFAVLFSSTPVSGLPLLIHSDLVVEYLHLQNQRGGLGLQVFEVRAQSNLIVCKM